MATGCTSTLMSKNEGEKYFVYYNFIYVIWTTTAVHTQHYQRESTYVCACMHIVKAERNKIGY